MSDEFTLEEITELAGVFPPGRTARALLREAGFPMTHVPGLPESAVALWEQVSEDLANGVLSDGRYRILQAASRRFPDNRLFQVDQAVQVSVDGPRSPRTVAQAWRVLLVGASPSDNERIRPDRDAKAITEAGARGHLLLEYCPAAAATDLGRVLDFRPDILHLACHGAGDDLIFEDVHGEEHRVPAQAVADTLRLYRDAGRSQLRGLVLASCDGDAVAARFAEVAEAVVAHRGALDDLCAVTFTRHLYAALEHTTDVGAAARIAAQHALLTDESCADVVTGLIVLPPGG
jgi:Effector-associated domain 1